jgi:hypothetical protein
VSGGPPPRCPRISLFTWFFIDHTGSYIVRQNGVIHLLHRRHDFSS